MLVPPHTRHEPQLAYNRYRVMTGLARATKTVGLHGDPNKAVVGHRI
jgi:hypothetical protein